MLPQAFPLGFSATRLIARLVISLFTLMAYLIGDEATNSHDHFPPSRVAAGEELEGHRSLPGKRAMTGIPRRPLSRLSRCGHALPPFFPLVLGG